METSTERPEYDEKTDVYRCSFCGVDVEQTGRMYEKQCWNCHEHWDYSPADVIAEDGNGPILEKPPTTGGTKPAAKPAARAKKAAPRKRS